MARKGHSIFNEELDDGAFETGAVTLARVMPLSAITLDKDFELMFPLDKEDEKGVEQIAQNMASRGYDGSQPLHVWVHVEDGETVYTLIDGHRRRRAAEMANLKDVPVFEHHFKDKNEAYLCAMGYQIDRRNLDDSDMLCAVTKFMEMGGTRKQGNLKEIIAARIGVSERTVSKAMVVAKDKEASEEVKARRKSVNEAYNELTARKKLSGSHKEPQRGGGKEGNAGIPGRTGNAQDAGISLPDMDEQEMAPAGAGADFQPHGDGIPDAEKKRRRGMLIYVAGKVTGVDRMKVMDKFGRARRELSVAGNEVLVPTCLPSSAELPSMAHADYMHICFAMIDVCDAVYMLRDWQSSQGAREELRYAQNCGKEIFYEDCETRDS